MSDYRELYTIKFKREVLYPDGSTSLLDEPFVARTTVNEEELNKSKSPSSIRVRIISSLVNKLMEKLMDEYAVAIDFSDQRENKGTWEFIGHNPNYSPFDGSCSDLYKCSKCQHVTSIRTKFCPNCGNGKKMEDDE